MRIGAVVIVAGIVASGAAAQKLSTPFDVDGNGIVDTWAESERFTATYVHSVRSTLVDFFAVQYEWPAVGMSGTIYPWVRSTAYSSYTYHWAGVNANWRQLQGLARFTPVPSGSAATVSGNAGFWDPHWANTSPLPPGAVEGLPDKTVVIQSGATKDAHEDEDAPLTADTAFETPATDGFPVYDVTVVSRITATDDGRLHYQFDVANHSDETIDVQWPDLGLSGPLAPGESMSHDYHSDLAAVVRPSSLTIGYTDIDAGTPWAEPDSRTMPAFVLVEVPEPTSAALLAVLGAGLALRRRRRRR
jgi:hypothetical protein